MFVLLLLALCFASLYAAWIASFGFMLLSAVESITVVLPDFIPALLVIGGWIAWYSWKVIREKKIHDRINKLPASALPVLELIPAPKRPEVPGREVYAPSKRDATDYTEEELRQLPTWKRIELMKQRETENKETP